MEKVTCENCGHEYEISLPNLAAIGGQDVVFIGYGENILVAVEDGRLFKLCPECEICTEFETD